MPNNYLKHLSASGEMAALIRGFDWSATSLGHPSRWPISLLNAVSIILSSKFPMFIWWGDDLIQFYNDAYRQSFGDTGKHPRALGQNGIECWQEIWPVIKPLIDQVLAGGESTWSEDQLIPIYRNGKLEDVFWTFSYSQLLNDNGQIGGVLVTCTETTHKTLALKKISETKAELEFAINAAGLATWDLDPKTGQFNCNERLKKWFGLSRDSEVQLARGIEAIAPEDQSRVSQAISQALEYTLGGNFDIEYTILNPQTNLPRIVRAVGKTIFDNLENPIRFSGILQDITETRSSVNKLINAHHKLELALDQSVLSKKAAQLGTFDMDLVKGSMEWDMRCRTLFGINHGEEVSYEHDFVGGLHPDDRGRVISIIDKVFDKKATGGDYDVEYRTVGAEDGIIRWVHAKGKAYFDEHDRPLRFIGSVLDITEQKTDELRKNDFISMVSHELKTPLTSLKGYIQVLEHQANKRGDSFTANALSKADKQISRMGNLIKSFLDLSRLEAGKINLERENVYIHNLIDQVLEDMGIFSTSHSISVLQGEELLVNVDCEKIRSVISNLLGNAIKYSPVGSKVEISYSKQDNFVKVNVKDEGSGIKSSDIDRLFERFYRAESSNTGTTPGFGIGLYLCSEILARHNGKIGVDNSSAKGSTFYFLLPIADAVAF